MFMYPYSITLSNVSYAIEALIPHLALPKNAQPCRVINAVALKFTNSVRALAQKFSTRNPSERACKRFSFRAMSTCISQVGDHQIIRVDF